MSENETTKLLIITQFFPPESMGGAHRWEKIAANLDESVEPHILTTFPTFPFGEFDRRWHPMEQERLNGLPITRLFTYQPASDSSFGRILNYAIFSLLSSLYVLVMGWRYDCIVTMSAPHTTFLPGLVGKLMGRAWIIDIFDLWIDNAADLGYVDEDSILYRLVSGLERLSFASADAVFVITNTMGEYYEHKYESLEFNLYLIPFGVDTELFTSSANSGESKDLIYTGNVGTGQAFEPFLKGFARVDGDLELMIVGDGERRVELEALVEELDIDGRVSFEGYVPRCEIPSLVSSSHISIVPLKTENKLDYARPTKLLESMAVGTPYVASAVKEIERLTKEHKTGEAVENKPKVISKALKRLSSNREVRTELGNNGEEFIKENHDWNAIGQKVTNAVRTIRN